MDPDTAGCLHNGLIVRVKAEVILLPTVNQSIRLGNRHPSGTRDQFFPFSLLFFFFTVSGLLMWVALSDEKSSLCFSVFAGHRKRSLSQF
jgi:hypothetical protein